MEGCVLHTTEDGVGPDLVAQRMDVDVLGRTSGDGDAFHFASEQSTIDGDHELRFHEQVGIAVLCQSIVDGCLLAIGKTSALDSLRWCNAGKLSCRGIPVFSET